MADQIETALAAVEWPEPWFALADDGAPFLAELRREVRSGDPLSGPEVRAVARRDDRDDVLFMLPNAATPLALVHLTWSGRPDLHPGFPSTVWFTTLTDFLAHPGVSDDPPV